MGSVLMKTKKGNLIIGLYYDNLKQAEQRKESQEKVDNGRFLILKAPKGYVVVAEKQFK